MKKVELNTRLGYEGSGLLKKMILERMKEKGQTIEATIDEFALPPSVFPDKDGMFELDGERMNVETFHARWPGRRIVVIKARDE